MLLSEMEEPTSAEPEIVTPLAFSAALITLSPAMTLITGAVGAVLSVSTTKLRVERSLIFPARSLAETLMVSSPSPKVLAGSATLKDQAPVPSATVLAVKPDVLLVKAMLAPASAVPEIVTPLEFSAELIMLSPAMALITGAVGAVVSIVMA